MMLSKNYSTPFIAVLTVNALGLSGCQTLANQSSQSSNLSVNGAYQNDSQTQLINAIRHTLYRNQDWIAEHQLYLSKTAAANTPAELGSLDKVTECQQQHDDALVAQMLKDNMDSYSEVATLSADSQAPYNVIKTTYLNCYQVAYDAYIDSTGTNEDNYLTDSLDDSEDQQSDEQSLAEAIPIEGLSDLVKTLGLDNAQIGSLNNFISKSGKLTMTGNYRPLQGYVAVQLDAGFENKNLKYHYRLPLVANWQRQTLYVKPDVVMPTVALQLDNQLGMQWQDKWYKFSRPSTDNLPTDVVTKQWFLALQDSFAQLPASQFRQVSASELMPNIAYAKQKVATNGTIILWQQTAKEQDTWYQEVISRFITKMDDYFANHKKPKQDLQTWQDYRTKLNDYLEKRLASEPDEQDGIAGQQVYFVIANNQIKQLYAQNMATLSSQPVQIHSWLTFNPDTHQLAKVNTPAHLTTLVNTIHDTTDTRSNVIDGKAEIKRLRELEPSRRLFGTTPDWLKKYEAYDKLLNKKMKIR